MGLDMHVYRTKEKIDPTGHARPSDTVIPDGAVLGPDGKLDWDKYEKLKKKFEVVYWRKHANLHGWFKQLWKNKGGKPESDFFGDDFNGGDWVRIDPVDLDDLAAGIKAGRLPHTSGFFFGASCGDESERKADLKFIAKARRLQKDGWTLFYTSSW